MKTIIGFNQPFTLSFLISKHEKDNTIAQLTGRKFSIKEYKQAPAMMQVFLEVRNITDAYDTYQYVFR